MSGEAALLSPEECLLICPGLATGHELCTISRPHLHGSFAKSSHSKSITVKLRCKLKINYNDKKIKIDGMRRKQTELFLFFKRTVILFLFL